MLAERVEELEKGKESRVAVVGETKKKRKSSAVKKSRRKYRLLEEKKTKQHSTEAAGIVPGELTETSGDRED